MNKGIKRFGKGMSYTVAGTVILAFTFDAAWSQNTDGSGYTLYDNIDYVTRPGSNLLKHFSSVDEVKKYAESVGISYFVYNPAVV